MTLIPRRAAGYNHLIAHESGEIYNVEVSSRQFAIQYGEAGYIVHTNHFLDPVMQKIEDEPEVLVSTRVRYFRALTKIERDRKPYGRNSTIHFEGPCKFPRFGMQSH